jgi:cytochrome P450
MASIALERKAPALPNGIDLGGGVMGVLRVIRMFGGDQLKPMVKLREQYGPTYTVTVGGEQFVIFTKPDDLHDILVEHADSFYKNADYTDPKRGLARFVGQGLLTSDGALWKRQRKLVAPAFHAKRIGTYADTMTAYTAALVDTWRSGETRDITKETAALTLRIVGKTLFDVDASGANAASVLSAMETIQDMQGTLTLIPDWIPTPVNLRRKRSLRELDRLVYGIIAERQANEGDRGDLLSMLVAARDEYGQPMDTEQIRNEAVTLFLAGHETTANTLNWTFVLLSQHPEIEAALHAELDAVLGGRAPTLADLEQLKYTEQVIKESMRLYPPAWSVGRVAIEDVQVGEWTLPKGTRIGIITYLTHHDPELWDQPEQFDPSRFGPEREANIPKYAYLPFGGGPRVCIGNHFAMMEAKLLLAGIASRYQLRLAEGHRVEMLPRITLNPKGGLLMTLWERK